MVDHHQHQIVCCMCGDVGFPDKLFRCNKCRNRFQHSYCSSYHSESSEQMKVCDWCQSEERTTRSHTSSTKKSIAINESTGFTHRSEYAGDKIKQHEDGGSGGGDKGKSPTGTPSPRPTTRRYKLLKDVMC
ncbi:hypothetical protein RJ641_016245 [Dillenia turbinata]|uniref:PHD-type zinc finger plants domain-containing protein n=1 Tax=Dillenia turbinata TaxID=194707 RepID=A0AAN8Z0U7_9MAGN